VFSIVKILCEFCAALSTTTATNNNHGMVYECSERLTINNEVCQNQCSHGDIPLKNKDINMKLILGLVPVMSLLPCPTSD
jgi:hypothetical protein